MYGPHMCSEIYWLLQFCQCSVHLSDVDHFVESSVGAAGDLQLVRIIFLAAPSLSVSADGSSDVQFKVVSEHPECQLWVRRSVPSIDPRETQKYFPPIIVHMRQKGVH